MTDLGQRLKDFLRFEELVNEIAKKEIVFSEFSFGQWSEDIAAEMEALKAELETVRVRMHKHLEIDDLIADRNRKKDADDEE